MASPSLQPGFVLHRRDYRDSSLLLELLTRDRGRIVAIAKGAKVGKRRQTGVLQAFAPLLVACQGRGEILTLCKVEAAATPFALPGKRLYCGLYVNELVLYLTAREDPQPQLFAAYLEVLGELAIVDDVDQPLRRFELSLLSTLGFGLQLTVEADGRTPIDANQYYDYQTDLGVVPGQAHGWLSGKTLLALAHREQLSDPQIKLEARRLLRLAIGAQLGNKKLRSRELFRKSN
jgi:DNA repair protein RecO (recombination protein O)